MIDIPKLNFFMTNMALEKEHPVILWLDDERDPNATYLSTFGYEPGEYKPTWVEHTVCRINPGTWDIHWVSNYEQFVNYIELAGIPDIICFDHDLGEQITGKDCANYLVNILVERNLLGPAIRSQSFNPSGVRNILGLFYNWHKEWLKRNPNDNRNPLKYK